MGEEKPEEDWEILIQSIPVPYGEVNLHLLVCGRNAKSYA